MKNRKTSSMTLLKRMILNWMMILAKCLSVVTQLLLHLLQRKKPLKSLKKKLTMQKPDQKPLPRHRKLIPKNPIRLQKKFKKELLTTYHFLHKTKTRKNFSFLPGFSLPFLFKNCRLTHYLQLNSKQDCFLYFGSLNELFSETILLNTRCSLEESWESTQKYP